MRSAPSASVSWRVPPSVVLGNHGKVRIGIKGDDRATLRHCRRAVDTELSGANYRLDRVTTCYRRIGDGESYGRAQCPIVFPAGFRIDKSHPETCDSA